MKTLGRLALLAGLAVAALPATARAATFKIIGEEATGLTASVDGDGSVRTIATAGFDGLLEDVGERHRILGRAQVTMTIVVRENELLGATVVFSQAARRPVTIDINPCWFELTNERDFTSVDFGADVVEKIEAASRGTIEPCLKEWLQQRLGLLGAQIVEPLLKSGTTLLPPRS
ncbi:MAG TPA: hypothetical protein VGQ33_24250 [Vicinamibacteria bacterium]|jgi:hypothetical protein|nr:hypothetical protein [Vicinamibacteria bacterium]